METIFGDSTHQKANANKNKCLDKEVAIVKKVYEDELLDEINKDREAHGKKPLKEKDKHQPPTSGETSSEDSETSVEIPSDVKTQKKQYH